MKSLVIFLYEWKHFTRSPFKVVALLLFIVAGVYGLHNGAALYQQQAMEIAKIEADAAEARQEYIAYYEQGKKGPEQRPWIDVSTPFWAIRYSGIHHFKKPSPAMVYSIGQAEQYGFYKKVTFWSSPYDADMTKEIANPERLQTATLDFSFTLLFLLPLLLLILLYNLQSAESEQGFLPLIEVQVGKKSTWLLSRIAFYLILTFLASVVLVLYGGTLTPVWNAAPKALGQVLLFLVGYLFLWTALYYPMLRLGKSIVGNTLPMVGIWLLLAFIIPATVHQWVSLSKPTNLMTDFIDAKRDKQEQLFQQTDSLLRAQLNDLFPEISISAAAQDSLKSYYAMNQSGAALANELVKESIAPMEQDQQEKNELIKATYYINPITFFQNKLNTITQTHYDDYQNYRNEIQILIDKQNRTLVLDIWNEQKVDKQIFLNYQENLSNL